MNLITFVEFCSVMFNYNDYTFLDVQSSNLLLYKVFWLLGYYIVYSSE
jgi:hypothetical protein